ncbi:MAG: nicotinate (nicotinamide) nucleotide adenylyltransferase [Ignavibacteria bacterium]|nr:nicotinate (nicotinamide) nucleotide adenylyltransferase [Ignavibacteria bacterium]
MKKRIGIFGGTFNPPHIAHKIAAEFCRQELELDKVMFIPSGNHPLKDSIDPEHRLNMAVATFSGDENFEVNEIEIKNKVEKSFTVNTLRELKEIYESDTQFILLIGADNLLELHKWKDPHQIFDLAQVAVMYRPGYEIASAENQFLSKVTSVEIPLMEISSTMIRDRVMKGLSVKYLVDPQVEVYIKEKNLYR